MIKRFPMVFALMLAMTLLVAPHAEAKRFGGGKSFGKSYKTSPVQRQPAQNMNTLGKTNPNKAGQTQGASKKGLLGGILGGVLAGGLIAALFGGAFSGFQFMDMLILAVVAFVIFKVVKAWKGKKTTPLGHRESYAGGSPQQREQQDHRPQSMGRTNAGGFSSTDSDVPCRLPASFNAEAFLKGSCDHYRTLQSAWNTNDLSKIREYTSDTMMEVLRQERVGLVGEQHTEILFVNAEIGRADYTRELAEISVIFTGRYRDASENIEADFKDIWHLERDLRRSNSPWLIVGIES